MPAMTASLVIRQTADLHPVARSHGVFQTNSAGEALVTILLLDHFDLCDLAFLVDALDLANAAAKRVTFTTTCVGITAGYVQSSSSIPVAVSQAISDLDEVSNLVVLGGRQLPRRDWFKVSTFLQRLSKSKCHIGAIGEAIQLLIESYVVAEENIVAPADFRYVWKELYPDTQLVAALFAVGNRRFTCRGYLSTFDLALRIIGEVAGSDIANKIANQANLGRVRTGKEYCGRELMVAGPVPLLAKALSLFDDLQDEPRTTKDVAKLMGISLRQLQRLFCKHLGISPRDYIMSIRLEKANQLLCGTSMTVTEVGIAVGFISLSHFARVYRSRYGRSPRSDRSETADHRSGERSCSQPPGISRRSAEKKTFNFIPTVGGYRYEQG